MTILIRPSRPMGRRRGSALAAAIAALASSACTATPPTITPGALPTTTEGVPIGRGTALIITVPPPDRAAPAPLGTLPPVSLAERGLVSDPGGAFTIEVPVGWAEKRQQLGSKDVRLGTAFNNPAGVGLVSITQFDNGKRPTSLGFTANQVLELTGFTDQLDFREFAREKVIDREDEAMRVDVGFTTPQGLDMRSLVLFQIDDTTFSMVNVALPDASWKANEDSARAILRSYRGPLGGPPQAVPSAP